MINKTITALMVLSITMTACRTSETPDANPPSNGKDNGFRMNIELPQNKVNTYATISAEDGEESVSSLHLLFFEGSGQKRFIESYDASPEVGQPLNMSQPINVDFEPTSLLNNSTDYNILVIANSERYISGSVEGMTFEEAINSYTATVTGASDSEDNSQAINPSDLLMSAQVFKAADQESVDVKLLRALSRFDVENRAVGYNLVSVSIWNAYPETSVWQKDFPTFNKSRIERFYGVDVLNNTVRGGLYAFENHVYDPMPERDDNRTTCLILGIEDPLSQISYYRVNINAKNIGQQLKRNNVYNLVVNNVLKTGANSERDAYTSKETLLDMNINNWNLDDSGSLQYDENNVLAVPSTNIVFTPQAESRQFNIFTLGEGNLFISKSYLPEGITAELSGKVLTINVTQNNEERSGHIELTFGKLQATINISQTGQHDHYIELSSYSVPMFPATAGSQMVGNITVTSSGSWTAKIYNAGFTFQSGSDQTTLTGDNGGTFTISTFSVNGDPLPRYAFVHVSLDDDPDVSRTIVLSQQGVGNIDITPSNMTAINYDAEGEPIDNATFSVVTEGSAYSVALEGADADKFHVVNNGNDSYTVMAMRNVKAAPLSAQVRVSLDLSPNLKKIITLHQDAHAIALSPDPTGFAVIPAAGGSAPEVTVTSSAAWEATLSGFYADAKFNNGLKTITGNTGEKFTVTVDPNITPEVNPTIEVIVKVAGTAAQTKFTLRQGQFILKDLLVVTGDNDNYDSFDPTSSTTYRTRFDRFWDEFANSSANFSVYGTVKTGRISHKGESSSTNYTPGSANIYLHNAIATNAAQKTDIRNWLSSSPSHVAIVTHNYTYLRDRIENTFGDLGYVSYNQQAGISSSERYRVNGDPAKNQELFDYLFVNGPFGAVNPANVSLSTGDTYTGTIIGYPSSFVPIIKHPTIANAVVVGIDPVNRILFVGDPEMFSNYDADSRANWDNPDNLRFLRNLLAWMANTAMYGDAFNGQFKK